MDAAVGEVTVGGTVGFVVFVGVGVGLLAWIGRLILRRWLPDGSLLAGMVLGGIGAGLLARPSSLLEPSSVDFLTLSPAWLAVALILGLIATFAMLSVALADRWSLKWPIVRNTSTVFALAPLVVLITFPPISVVLIAATAARARVGEIDVAAPWVKRMDTVGRYVVGVGAVLGAGWTGVAAGEIVLS